MAILFVLAGHFAGSGCLGAFGVEVFFALSGRLMAVILVEQKQPLGQFAYRRLVRILPALSLFIAAMVLLSLATGVPSDQVRRSATAAALFFSNYLVGGQILTVFQHTWSLAVEEHSYLTLAALVTILGRNPERCSRAAFGLATLMMAGAVVRSVIGHEGWLLYLRSETRGASILISFAITLNSRNLAAKIPSAALQWIPLVTFAAALVLAAPQVPSPVFYTAGTFLLALSVNLAEHSHALVKRILLDPVLCWFGLISFSLYLWQQPLYTAHVTGTSFMVAVPVALLLGAASYYLIESPARRRLRRDRSSEPAFVAHSTRI